MKHISIFLVLLVCLMAFAASAAFADGVSVSEVSGKTIIPV